MLVREIIKGLTAYFSVLSLFSRLNLWRYVGITALVSVAVFAGLVLVALTIGALVWEGIVSRIEAEWLVTLLSGLSVLLTLVLSLLVFKHLVLIFAAPWMGKVSDKVQAFREQELGIESQIEAKTASYARSIKLNLRLLSREVLISIPLLVASLFPGVNIFALGGLFLIQSYFVGAGCLDYSLETRYDYKSSLAFLEEHKGLAIGVGAGFVLLLLTAVGFLIAPSLGAATAGYVMAEKAYTKNATA